MSKYLASTLQNVQYRSPGFKIIPITEPVSYNSGYPAYPYFPGGVGNPMMAVLGTLQETSPVEHRYRIVRSRGGNCTQPGMAYYRLMQPTGTTSMLGGQSLAVAAEFCGPVAQPGIYSAGALQAAGLLP